MKAITKLSSSLGRRDQAPNEQLAKEIIQKKDHAAIKELVAHLNDKNKTIQGDCIKVLEEIGVQNPEMVKDYCDDFGKLLDSKNNRMIWGAMAALNAIASSNNREVYQLLPKIIAAADKGTVITKDNAVGVLIQLGKNRKYAQDCVPLLLEQILKAPDNQFAMYAERAMTLIDESNKKAFVGILNKRLVGLEKDSQKKRVERVLKKLK
jgi:hypothetical protein